MTCGAARRGGAAFELDADTHDPARFSDAELVEAMAGLERIAGWGAGWWTAN